MWTSLVTSVKVSEIFFVFFIVGGSKHYFHFLLNLFPLILLVSSWFFHLAFFFSPNTLTFLLLLDGHTSSYNQKLRLMCNTLQYFFLLVFLINFLKRWCSLLVKACKFLKTKVCNGFFKGPLKMQWEKIFFN